MKATNFIKNQNNKINRKVYDNICFQLEFDILTFTYFYVAIFFSYTKTDL